MGLLNALGFLSRLPLPAVAHLPSRAALGWYGIAGAIIGIIVASVAEMGVFLAGPWVGAALAVAASLWLTGAMHEDALADCADAFWGSQDREKMHEILKDPRLGSYGVAALGISLILKVLVIGELAQFDSPGLLTGAVVATYGLSRAWAVWLMGSLKPAPGSRGLGRTVGGGVAPKHILGAFIGAFWVCGLVSKFVYGKWLPVWLAGATGFFIAIWLKGVFLRRLGGFTGDCVGALVSLSETASLIVIFVVLRAG